MTRLEVSLSSAASQHLGFDNDILGPGCVSYK